MNGFLHEMAEGSAKRWHDAATSETMEHLRSRALHRRPPTRPRPHSKFDVIAEIKLVAPSSGRLAAPGPDRDAFVAEQARHYAGAGACAISVLTEPDRFDGRLHDLEVVASAVDVPVLRKDFLVHPGQVWESRAAGASGVLLIARMLDDAMLDRLCDASACAGLFVLLEAFDGVDLQRIHRVVARWHPNAPPIWVGVNTRDLDTLQTDPTRLRTLAPLLPPGVPCVAESGIKTGKDAAEVRRLGYSLALVGSALMGSEDPSRLVRELLDDGRAAAPSNGQTLH